MKVFWKLCLLSAILVACEEKDLSVENPAPPEENIKLSTSFIYEDVQLKKDTIYSNNFGQYFYIDDVKLLVSNFFFFHEDGDTTYAKPQSFQKYTFDHQTNLALAVPAGGYTVKYGFTLGMDSLTTIKARPEEVAENSALRDQDFIRNDGYGYNSMVIKGRFLDPAKPLDTVGTAFQFNLGGYEIYRSLESDWLNFSVTNRGEVRLITVVDLASVMANFDIKKRLLVLSDYNNPIDLSIAKNMMLNLNIHLF